VPYFSRKHSPVEINYAINKEELLAIVWNFKAEDSLLEDSRHTFEFMANNKI
jgi:hypothetical protein